LLPHPHSYALSRANTPHALLHTYTLYILYSEKMLSFSKIVTLSAVAFGTLTQALPLVQRDAGINARNSDLTTRCDSGCGTLAEVFVGLKADLDVKLDVCVDLSVETLAEVDINVALEGALDLIVKATADVKALASLDIEAVLKDETGVELTVEACLALVSAVVELVFKALLQITVVVKDYTQLSAVLCTVVKAVYCLLQAVVDLLKLYVKVELSECIKVVLNLDVVVKVLAVLNLNLAVVL